jgi:hypothetical protein
MVDDVQIDTSFYDVIKVDMVYDNSKDLKLKVPLEGFSGDGLLLILPISSSFSVDHS